jgi:hypothetical protein
MRQPVEYQGNSRIAPGVEAKADSSPFRPHFHDGSAEVRGNHGFSLTRCAIANVLLVLAIACRIGFSDAAPESQPNAVSADARVVQSMHADWIGELIDVLTGGGGGDDDEDDPKDPNP